MIFLAIGLYIIGYIAIVLEFFVPAGGLVGLAGMGSIAGGIALIFIHYGRVLGYIFLSAAVIITPILILLYFKYFPRSFLGKRLILADRQEKDEGFVAHSLSQYSELKGKVGKCLTMLRPSGMALIDGKRYSVVTDGEFIEKGAEIEVREVDGSRIIVRKKREEEEK